VSRVTAPPLCGRFARRRQSLEFKGGGAAQHAVGRQKETTDEHRWKLLEMNTDAAWQFFATDDNLIIANICVYQCSICVHLWFLLLSCAARCVRRLVDPYDSVFAARQLFKPISADHLRHGVRLYDEHLQNSSRRIS